MFILSPVAANIGAAAGQILVSAKGETVSHAPTATMTREETISGQLARLCMNGILLVRMT
ncbi:MAG TPA: hypothetical protein VLH18_04175 [Candidatus Limnocylindrales bacterium]|nr:hypothetical protein [Candidatus Limnocylindrales bacterium]